MLSQLRGRIDQRLCGASASLKTPSSVSTMIMPSVPRCGTGGGSVTSSFLRCGITIRPSSQVRQRMLRNTRITAITTKRSRPMKISDTGSAVYRYIISTCFDAAKYCSSSISR